MRDPIRARGVPVAEDYEIVDPAPYGVPLARFLAEFPGIGDRVDVEKDGAVPRIVVWLLPGEPRPPVPATWRGYQVDVRPPVQGYPLGGGDETIVPPQVDGKTDAAISPDDRARQAEFPVGVAFAVFGLIFGGFVLSFFVKRTPAGRWYLGGLRGDESARQEEW